MANELKVNSESELSFLKLELKLNSQRFQFKSVVQANVPRQFSKSYGHCITREKLEPQCYYIILFPMYNFHCYFRRLNLVPVKQ